MNVWTSLREVYAGKYYDVPDAEVAPVALSQQFGDLVGALMYSAVFWPEFEAVGHRVLYKGWHDDTSIAGAESDSFWANGVDAWQWVEVADLFFAESGFPSAVLADRLEERFEAFLSEILRQTWTAKLKADYPSRGFVVRTLAPDDPHGWIIYWRDEDAGSLV
jgi:hypothetical protein